MRRLSFVRLFLAASVLFAVFPVKAQNSSYFEKFPSRTGTHVITRFNPAGHYIVVSGQMSEWGFFIVRDGYTTRTFDLPLAPGSGAGQVGSASYGHTVHDMQIYGSTCWFCGKRWNRIYEFGMPAYPGAPIPIIESVDSLPYVGKFDIAGAVAGTAVVKIMYFPTSDNLMRLNRLATTGDGVVMIGEQGSAHNTVLVELTENTTNNTYKIIQSSFSEEVFMDLVRTGNKVVTLSRFNNPIHTGFYNYTFGLRYGTPNSFVSTGNTMYGYDTYYPFCDTRAKFTGVDPIILSNVNNSINLTNAVTVSFVSTSATAYVGQLISYHIASQGAMPTDVLWTAGKDYYTKIKDAKFNKPLTFNTFMAVLLEDNNGNSVLRFPYLNVGNTSYSDTILYAADPKLESLAPFQYMSNSFETYAAGYYALDYSKISFLEEYELHDHFNPSNPATCFSVKLGTIHSIPSEYYPSTMTDKPLVVVSTKTGVFEQNTISATVLESIFDCQRSRE